MSKLTFREELTLSAEEYIKNISVKELIETIKIRLRESFRTREYTISLIYPLEKHISTGFYHKDTISFTIPDGISPFAYRQLFINEFQKLGFSEDCMELSITEKSGFISYNIKLKW